MGMFKFNFREMFGKPAPEGTPLVLPTAPEFSYLPPTLFKNKKWVWHDNSKRVGIIYDMREFGFVDVAFTNELGETVTIERVRAGELRIAKYEEIPAPRRPEDKSAAFRLGYY